MNPADLDYPIIGLADAEPRAASWELFWCIEEFSICSRLGLAERMGMLIVDVGGRCWRVSSVQDLGVTGASRSPLSMLFIGYRRVDQTLDPIPEMTFEDAKVRLCAAIQSNPYHWRDDEAIAGEDGPPREEQDLLDEMKAQVMRSSSVLELIRNFWEEDPEYSLAKLEEWRAKRRKRTHRR